MKFCCCCCCCHSHSVTRTPVHAELHTAILSNTDNINNNDLRHQITTFHHTECQIVTLNKLHETHPWAASSEHLLLPCTCNGHQNSCKSINVLSVNAIKERLLPFLFPTHSTAVYTNVWVIFLPCHSSDRLSKTTKNLSLPITAENQSSNYKYDSL
jgi:hypothetical protein